MKKFFNRRKRLFSENGFVDDETTDNNETDSDEEVSSDEDGMETEESYSVEDGTEAEGAGSGEDGTETEELDSREDGTAGRTDDEEIDGEETDEGTDEEDDIEEIDGEGTDEEVNIAEINSEGTDGEIDNEEADEETDDEEIDSVGTDEETDDEEADDVNEESSEENTSWKESRREYRRKRRIRNQIIVYGVVALFLAVLVVSGISVGRKVSKIIKEKTKNEEQMAENGQGEDGDIEGEPEEILIEAPPEIEEITLDEQLEEIVNNCISVMPLQDKVAGLFVITPEALTGVGTVIQAGEGTQDALSNYAVGGLIYFSQNIQDREQLSQMLSNTVSMSKYPIFLAVDEEGGSVSRVADSSIEVAKLDDMQAIGSAGDTTAAYEAGITIGSYLNELGFNLDFAPVADVVLNAAASPLGKRSFGADPSLCADMVSNVVEGIQGTSVSACLKHFPGIGSSNEDTHEGKVEITKTLEEMKNFDFIPFQAGIDAGADLVMVSHITASSVDSEGLPSSLSRTMITDVLRGELGFEGVIITDALDMSAISDYYTSEEAAVGAIMAGADMLLMPEDFEAAYEGLLEAVQNGRISEERIDESLRRIYRIKYADKLDMD